MSHRIAKLSLAFATALLAALPVVASAQTSRVDGMNVPGDFIKDYSGIYTYVSEVANVGNLVYGELGNWAGDPNDTPFDRSVGVVLGNLFDGNAGTWALHLRELTPALGTGEFFGSPTAGGFDPNVNQWESFDLMWAKKFGTTSFGLRLNRSHGKLEGDGAFLGTGSLTSLEYDFTQADPNLARNIMGFGAGASFELNANSTAQVSILYQQRTFSLEDSAGTAVPIGFEDDGPTTFQFAGRLFWQWQPDVMVVPVIKYASFDLSRTQAGGGPNLENTLKSWEAGAAGNWTLGQNDLLVLGLLFAQNKVEQDEALFGPAGTITETFYPMLFAALETHVNSWLTLRFGAQKGAWHKLEFETDAGPEATISTSPFSMSLGAGVKLGPLQLDAVLNDAIAQNGLYFISGTSNEPLASRVTATYSF